MRSVKTLLIVALALSMGSMAYADLQETTIDGSIRIRGNYYDSDSADAAFVEQRTRLGVKADFTDDVSVYIEFDAYNNFGDSLRDDPVMGDGGLFGAGVGAGGSDVELYQAYIQVDELWGSAVSARLGRQEISLGSEWLVGVNDASSIYTGLSFDGLRLTYTADVFTLDFLALKLAESTTFSGAGAGDFGDNDSDLYALYGSYTGIEDWVIDAYWIFLREDADDAASVAFSGVDADIHTIGLRAAGNVGNFDLEGEIAFQFGDADTAGGDTDYDGIGINTEVGYTFDANYEPRVYLGVVFLEGTDDADEAGFNRLFSNWEYSEFLANTDLSNVIIIRGGVSASVRENLDLGLDIAWFQVDEDLTGSDDDLGWETNLHAEYRYSDDLTFRAGWAHFFTDDGLEDGNIITGSGYPGTAPLATGDDDDLDYLYFETEISF